MHSLMSTNSSSTESWMSNDIDCQFAICETCFWSATIFKSAEQQNTNNNNSDKDIFHSCPMCSNSNISLITIANGIFRK
jgi:hypothetical protein